MQTAFHKEFEKGNENYNYYYERKKKKSQYRNIKDVRKKKSNKKL